MSPRSEEFIEQARDRLVAAREALAADHFLAAVEGMLELPGESEA